MNILKININKIGNQQNRSYVRGKDFLPGASKPLLLFNDVSRDGHPTIGFGSRPF